MMKALGSLSLTSLLVSALAVALPAPEPAVVAASAALAPAKRPGLKNRRKIKALLRRKGLAKLPSVSSALAGRAPRRRAGVAATVTGTPPTLLSIPSQSIEDLFWQPGIVDAIVAGSPSPAQCGQFWAGSRDGESGGLGACHMAESVGYSFGDILSGETSLCYMKRLPTPDNVAAGAVVLVSGQFPGGDVTRLFSVPGSSTSRIVQVAVSGEPEGEQQVFLRVYSEAENRAAGNLYAVDIWFCPGEEPPRGFNRIRIANLGEFTVEDQFREDEGTHISTVTGYLAFEGGRMIYDTTRSRRALVSSTHLFGSFKADHEIRPDNTIASRSYDGFGGGTRKAYVVTSFSGTGPESLRFLAGAFKERSSWDSFESERLGSTEFRDTFYAASPGSALEGRLAAVDLGSDDFFATPPSASVDTSGFSCDLTPDLAVALDLSNPTIRAAVEPCESRLWERMHFCHEDPTVRAAEMAFPAACFGPH
jgi:hypothetical protein